MQRMVSIVLLFAETDCSLSGFRFTLLVMQERLANENVNYYLPDIVQKYLRFNHFSLRSAVVGVPNNLAQGTRASYNLQIL